MGGNLLRRKNIIRVIILLTLIFLFAFNAIDGKADDDRPLRAVPQSAIQVSQSRSSSGYSELTSNSLITPYALEQPLTQRYIAQFSSPAGVEYLNSVLERANIYLPFIKQEIAKRNLPPELVWLPVIESGFQITARSKSGAVGLWQFMLNSISGYDIKVNDTVDERRDFIKSTKGALKKLEDNYQTLGNWELALAAYNSGLGSVTRITQRTKSNDYWELSRKGEFKQETEHYLPKLIAAAYVISQPRRYNINVWHKTFEWEAVSLPRQVSLDIVAETAGIDRNLLRRLNAQLLYGISPAGYELIVPKANTEQVNLVLEREDLKLIRYHYHVVRQGDTLWAMSGHYGTSLDIIEQHNPGISNRYLRIGETVIIPAFNDVTPPSRSAVIHVFDGSHVVKSGDTLWSLSRIYGVDPQDLADANNMTINQILREGRTLKVPILIE
jgi:membrane-bound lytic murein transglycosylase D